MSKEPELSKMTYQAAVNELGSQGARRVYLLSGEEDYLHEQFCHSLRQQLLAIGCADLDYLHLRTAVSMERLQNELELTPFLSAKRVVIARDSQLFAVAKDKSKAKQEELERFFTTIPSSSCLVLLESKLDLRQKRILQLIAAVDGVHIECKRQEPALLLKWLNSYLQQKTAARLERTAALSLIDRCDSAMREILFELNKLAAYANFCQLSKLDLACVDKLCRQDIKAKIFDLTDALSQGRIREAILVLEHLLQLKEPATLIHFMLSRHFRQLLVAKDCTQEQQLIKYLKVQAFVAQRLLQQARNFSLASLKSIYNTCFQSDLAIKAGQLDEILALELLIYKSKLALSK